ncbi:DegQ family serine endoprotease [Aquibium sp. A9E412]|uniref:DegQ family serine endoprotease n=1 Tax=Aquibium sp. A9E412 TaxID=2976767 RepID=UPI0025AFB3DE|nr:DegQ family serine endoprotease [Aquibium sp. A9E412]MDN2567446.1 DegQ family serine endoprotease [Aquibium sp. A9E412]
MTTAWQRMVAALAGAVLTAGLLTAAAAQGGGEGFLRELLPDLLRGSQEEATGSAPSAATGTRVPFGRDEIELSFAPLVRETAPAVVNVYASQEVRGRSPFAGDPFFEQFFGRLEMPPRVQSSLGSGVLVDASGIVVTNNHVIRGADAVKVAMSDGREYESEVLLKDESLDLAVLRIAADEPFPAVAIGDSDALEVGDLVLAIGNPFGVGQTTTSGIVSGLARSHIGISDFGFFIQTDAAINPGNSGGALIDMKGRLIGINTAIFSRSGGSIGIGFAIPSNMVRAVVDAAKNGAERFERPYFGAFFDPVTADVAEALGMARPGGAIVTEVTADSPAARAGLAAGDVIVALNGAAIEHPDALEYRLATQPIGTNAAVRILRRGEDRTLDVRLERAPGGQGRELVIEGGSPFAGARVAALSPRLAQRLRLPGNARGVAVVEVERGSPAGRLGLRPRDIVREVNGETIDSAETLKRLAEAGGRWWRFTIERDGRLLRQTLRF